MYRRLLRERLFGATTLCSFDILQTVEITNRFFFFLLKHEHFALHTLCHTKQNTLLAVLEVRIMTWFCSAEKAKPDHLLIFVSPIETFRRQWQQHQSLEYKRHSSLFWAEWRFAPIRSICLLKQVQGHYK